VGAIHDFVKIIIAHDVGSFFYAAGTVYLTSYFSHIVYSGAHPANFTRGIYFWKKSVRETCWYDSKHPPVYSSGAYPLIKTFRISLSLVSSMSFVEVQ
jgi:hypothetical protein